MPSDIAWFGNVVACCAGRQLVVAFPEQCQRPNTRVVACMAACMAAWRDSSGKGAEGAHILPVTVISQLAMDSSGRGDLTGEMEVGEVVAAVVDGEMGPNSPVERCATTGGAKKRGMSKDQATRCERLPSRPIPPIRGDPRPADPQTLHRLHSGDGDVRMTT